MISVIVLCILISDICFALDLKNDNEKKQTRTLFKLIYGGRYTG